MEEREVSTMKSYYGENIDRFNELFEAFGGESSNEYIYVCDVTNNFSRWSKAAVEDFGLPGEYIEDTFNMWIERIDEFYRSEYLKQIFDVFRGNKAGADLVYRAKNSEGKYIMCASNVKLLKDNNGVDRYFVCKIINYSKNDGIDTSTGLYSQKKMLEQMREYEQEERDYYIFTIAIRDFFIVNGNYGYEFGNRVLNQVGEYYHNVQIKLGEGAHLYKAEGTKFIFLLEADKHKLYEISALFGQFEKHFYEEFFLDEIHVTLEIYGSIVHVEKDDMDADKMFTASSYLIDKVREGTVNELVIFDKNIAQEKKKRLELLIEIKNSISDNFKGFYLCYQPIIDSGSLRMVGMEALIRWQSEEFGRVSPGRFIEWLESEPMFYELGLWILKTAMTDAKPFIKENSGFMLNVNLAFPQLQRKEFRRDLLKIMSECHFSSRNLKLELTERCKFIDDSVLVNVLSDFRHIGIKIALDDFGTGYSALDLLIKFPIDQIKIDKSFIDDITTSYPKQCLLEAITTYAKNLGKEVCIEGIEEEDVVNLIKAMFEVNTFQGYYFSKPLDIEELKEWDKTYNKQVYSRKYEEELPKCACQTGSVVHIEDYQRVK